jgi:hypothetical protein
LLLAPVFASGIFLFVEASVGLLDIVNAVAGWRLAGYVAGILLVSYAVTHYFVCRFEDQAGDGKS